MMKWKHLISLKGIESETLMQILEAVANLAMIFLNLLHMFYKKFISEVLVYYVIIILKVSF